MAKMSEIPETTVPTEQRALQELKIWPPNYHWSTRRILRSDDQLDAVINLGQMLNRYQEEGWEVFSVMPFANFDFVVVLRRVIEES